MAFLADDDDLPGPKSDRVTAPATANPDKYVSAADFNALRDALNELRAAIVTGEGSASELEYWQAKAAMLDPDAYVWEVGTVVDVTVPAGNGCYAINAYRCVLNDSGYLTFSLRPCDYNRPIYLPPGTTIRSQDFAPPDPSWWSENRTLAQLYYCDPALVIADDARYTSNPRRLYFERLSRLKTLTLKEVRAISTAGGDFEKYTRTSFPSITSGKALAVGAQAYDMVWIALYTGSETGPNLMSEINNWHTLRFAEAIGCPFKTSVFSGIETLAGNHYGNTVEPPGTGTNFGSTSNQPGYASLQYYELPSDW